MIRTMSKPKRTLKPEQAAECAALNALYLSKKEALKLTQKKLADAMGITPPSVFNYLNGQISLNARAAAKFAEMLRVPVSDFSPRLAEEIRSLTKSHTEGSNNGPVEQPSNSNRLLACPVCGRDDLGEGAMAAVQRHRTGEKTLEAQSADILAGTDAYWVPVRGDAMVSHRGFSFPEGMLILVSRTIEPRDGQYVVARKGADTTFRQLREDAGMLFLRPLNPAYLNTVCLSDGWEIVGTVVSARYPESIFM